MSCCCRLRMNVKHLQHFSCELKLNDDISVLLALAMLLLRSRDVVPSCNLAVISCEDLNTLHVGWRLICDDGKNIEARQHKSSIKPTHLNMFRVKQKSLSNQTS